jgi:hypothetical protein
MSAIFESFDGAETGLAALLFAGTFFFGGKVRPLKAFVRDGRSLISFGSGFAIAYVFLQVMPDLHQARSVIAAAYSLPYEGKATYLLALLGFLLFYAVDHMRTRLSFAGAESRAFKFHLSGFAAYVSLMTYLLVHGLDVLESVWLYAAAISCHFLTMDHSLRDEHGAAYEQGGCFVLSAMCLLGWGVAQLLLIPAWAAALLLAFISGAIIMNSTIAELPTKKQGHLFPFLAGGVLYAVMLLPFG